MVNIRQTRLAAQVHRYIINNSADGGFVEDNHGLVL